MVMESSKYMYIQHIYEAIEQQIESFCHIIF